MLDETAFAGPEHLDAGYVAGYDRKARFDPTEDLELLRARGLGAASTLVDLGAGTGTFALAAASLCKRVVAVDISPAMLSALRNRIDNLGVTNVECVEGGFLSYEHQGDAPSFVYTRNALHHLPDLWKAVALTRISALLAPGGTFVLRDLVFSFDPAEAEAGIWRWVASAAAERSSDGWTREELETHVRDEFSTYTWLLEPMLERAGFRIDDADYGSVGVYARFVCTNGG